MQSKKNNITSKILKTKTREGPSVDETMDKEKERELIKMGTPDTIPVNKDASEDRGT